VYILPTRQVPNGYGYLLDMGTVLYPWVRVEFFVYIDYTGMGMVLLYPTHTLLIPSIQNTTYSISFFFPSRPRFITNHWEANVVVIYSSKTMVTSGIFISLNLHVYYWVVCRRWK
jgi:hypothetical protein